MKSISIYAVTRNQNIGQLQKLERQLSGREYFLKMRTWELESMRSLVRELEAHMDEVYALRFFFIHSRFRDLERNLICFRSRTSRL